jgi:hypothetical protein
MLKPIIVILAITQPLTATPKPKEPHTVRYNTLSQDQLIKEQNEKILKMMFKQMIKDHVGEP